MRRTEQVDLSRFFVAIKAHLIRNVMRPLYLRFASQYSLIIALRTFFYLWSVITLDRSV